ncbi:SIMPL domain-containing protein [Arsenicitalea aurantiaca]|uniref:SIMPL domain-containing protein n=1 Tax=Arsenicitalea aurantiaca TaxID=1783274 RepID=A0A433XLT3_9HYPH|nr:SIMPL domain-containing protein [Arsenicitalea aurantiaca]RUT35031.1 SIMPL domain-containing protein [Arsenicitalea aurantiaca]
MRAAYFALPFVLMAGIALPAAAQSLDRAGAITIEGHGEVSAAPDTAFITSGVTTQGATAREALDANTAAMSELVESLREAGIERRDIQTSNFSVNPNYVYTDARDENGYSLPPRINGYQVSNTVTIRVRDLESLGQLLDRSVSVGANTINGISFTVDDPSALYDEARRAAFADARSRAELYADVAGVTLDDLVSISERRDVAQPYPMMRQSAMAEMAAGAPVPVEAGELTFSIDVTVTWSMDQD